MHSLMVEVPGILVDYVVVHEGGRQWEYGPTAGDVPATTGARRMAFVGRPIVEQSAGKVIGRRAFMEIRVREIS